jgi:hypothetical protein
MILITARHATPATCTPRDKQTRFSTRNKDKGKINQNISDSNLNLGNSSQSNQEIDHLVSQSPR